MAVETPDPLQVKIGDLDQYPELRGYLAKVCKAVGENLDVFQKDVGHTVGYVLGEVLTVHLSELLHPAAGLFSYEVKNAGMSFSVKELNWGEIGRQT